MSRHAVAFVRFFFADVKTDTNMWSIKSPVSCSFSDDYLGPILKSVVVKFVRESLHGNDREERSCLLATLTF